MLRGCGNYLMFLSYILFYSFIIIKMEKSLREILQLASPASFFQLTLCLIYQFEEGFRKAFLKEGDLHWALKNQLWMQRDSHKKAER